MRAEARLLGVGIDLTLPMGSDAPKPTAGGAKWEEVDRPEKVGLTNYTGDTLTRLDLPVLFDGHREQRDVEPELNAVLALTRGGGERPPDFILSGPFEYSGLRCVMEMPDWGEAVRNNAGVLTRQALTLKLLEFVDPDSIVFSENAASGGGGGAAAGKTKKRKTTVKTKKGQTLQKIAVQQFGDASRAQEIGKLNGIRDTRKKLPAGKVLRLPPTTPAPTP